MMEKNRLRAKRRRKPCECCGSQTLANKRRTTGAYLCNKCWNIPRQCAKTEREVLKAVGEWMQNHNHINMSSEWCELREQLKQGKIPEEKV